jgi:glycosyltransferase involved in cell wall biosynthesis
MMARADSVPTAVTFAVPGALWDWNATTVRTQGMGASEKSIVQTAFELAKDDARRVEVYGPVPEIEVRDRVRYWPRAQIRHVRDGKVIVSRSPGFGAALEAQGMTKGLDKILWLQDAWYPDLTAHQDDYEHIVVVSEWHRQAMHERHGVPIDRMTVITNPIDVSLYTGRNEPRKNDAFVFASSPDRGLIRLLELWPQIREALPEATLDVFYGWRGAQVLGMSGDSAWGQVYSKSRAQFEKIRHQPGVTVHGMVAPHVLANTLCRSGVWAYPTHFEETYGTIATEAIAAGMVPVTPRVAALGESADSINTLWTPSVDAADFAEAFVHACVDATMVPETHRVMASNAALTAHSTRVAADKWRKLL